MMTANARFAIESADEKPYDEGECRAGTFVCEPISGESRR